MTVWGILGAGTGGRQTNLHLEKWWPSEPWFNIKMTSYQYRKSHCGDKTILRPSYLRNGISYTDKMTSLYWIRALKSCGVMWTWGPLDRAVMWPRKYRKTSNISAPNLKIQILLESACSGLCATYWSQVLSGEWRCSWSSADRQCSNCIWLINNWIAYKGASYIRDLTVPDVSSTSIWIVK